MDSTPRAYRLKASNAYLTFSTAVGTSPRADDVDGIEIALSPFADQLVGGAFDPSDNPQVAAQFSIHYSAASAVVRRQLGIAEIQDAAVFDPLIADFIPKVAVVVDGANDGKFAPASVCVKTTSGETIDRRLDHVPGTLENPLSDAQVAAKFRDCATFGLKPLTAADAERLAASLNGVASRENLGGVFAGMHR